MPEPPWCVLIRHGQTAWSLSGRHTGRTDLPLLPEGEAQADALHGFVEGLIGGGSFASILVSPLLRARQTLERARLEGPVTVDDDLQEWDYGAFEGLTTPEICEAVPEWNLFDNGALDGETAGDVGRRADRVIERIRSGPGPVACVAHGHLLRVLASRWVGLEPGQARTLTLSPAAVCVLGWERTQPVIVQWNLRPAG